MAEVLNLDQVGRSLDRIKGQLSEALDLGQLDSIQRQAEALRVAAKKARLGVEWSNEFFKVRVAAMVDAGKLLAVMNKHPGGNPNLPGEKPGIKTLKELGLDYDFSSNAQSLAEREKHIASYYARGDIEEYFMHGPKGILHHIGWEATREFNAREQEKRTAETLRQAEEAVRKPVKPAQPTSGTQGQDTITVTPDDEDDGPDIIEIDPKLLKPEPQPEPPPEVQTPKAPPTVQRVKSLLRTAFDPSGNPHEKENARQAIERLDPRMDALEQDFEKDFAYFESVRESQNYWHDRTQETWRRNDALRNKLAEFQKVEDIIKKMESRDRERLRVIRELKAENDRLKAENETLKTKLAARK